MQEKFELITNHKSQFWTTIPQNGHCVQVTKVQANITVDKQHSKKSVQLIASKLKAKRKT